MRDKIMEDLKEENDILKQKVKKLEKENRDLLLVYSTTLTAIDVTQRLKDGDIEGVRQVIIDGLERNNIIKVMHPPIMSCKKGGF